jgi:hypothetical protein
MTFRNTAPGTGMESPSALPRLIAAIQRVLRTA